MAPTHATVIVTVALGNAHPHEVQAAIQKALNNLYFGFNTDIVPCDWAPDMDTVADATRVDYDDIVLIDLNPTHQIAAEA